MLEKDTYSDLNKFDRRDQQVFIANVFRQDFFAKGYTAQLSFHANFDGGERHYDKNGFHHPAGADRRGPRSLRPGLLSRLDRRRAHRPAEHLTHAFYQAFGEDGFNGIAGRRVDINAQMAALELSIDKDWLRLKLSGLLRERRSRPEEFDTATGFDTIFDRPFFIGGPFSFYVHQGFNLGGTSVNFKQRDSLVIDFRTSKSEGQSNFVNPGAYHCRLRQRRGYHAETEGVPERELHLDGRDGIDRQVLFTNHASNDIRVGLQPRISMAPAPDE